MWFIPLLRVILMKMNFEDFENKDLRDKLIICSKGLKSVIDYLAAPKEDWSPLIKILNEVETTEYIDEWFYKFIESTPKVIIEELDFNKNKEDWEYVDQSTFDQLRALYLNSNATDTLSTMIEQIHELGNYEIHSESKKISNLSYEPFKKYIELKNKSTPQ